VAAAARVPGKPFRLCSAFGRFRRALDNGNLLAARSNAAELKHVGLAEALELALLILAKEPTRFRAAALRWHARYCGDNKVSIEEGCRRTRAPGDAGGASG
jgi:hypothetical protein